MIARVALVALCLAVAVAVVSGRSLVLPKEFKQDSDQRGTVYHVVTFRFAHNVTTSQKNETMKRFRALKQQCVDPSTGTPYILGLYSGGANSPEGVDQQMEQGYIVHFRNVAERNYYVGQPFFFPYDPHHDAFKKFVGPLLDTTQPTPGVFVFDFTNV